MSERKRLVVVAAWIASLGLVAFVARAQDFGMTPQTPTVVTGADFGFRVVGTRPGRAIGQLVVRQNGQWVEADLGGMTVKQLSLR